MVHSHGELDESNETVCEGKKTAFITGVRIFFPSVYACIILSSTVKIPFQSTITIIFNKLNK